MTPPPAHPAGLPPPRSGPPPPLAPAEIERPVRNALDEDRGTGDLTSNTAVPEKARARASLIAKSDGVLAGLAVFARTFEMCDRKVRVELLAQDGSRCRKDDVVALVEGSARALLLAERTALNFVQRLSGTATATARFVRLAREAAGDKAPRILDTRKTTPGLRALEKYAVRCGGGENHRFGLYDEVMVKENHIELAGRSIEAVLSDLRGVLGPGIRITCEARDEKEALAAVDGGADVVLLDNMSAAELARLCPVLRARARERSKTEQTARANQTAKTDPMAKTDQTARTAQTARTVELEASGGVDERTIGAIAKSGVDRISIGALTHSAPALDLSLELEPLS